MRFTDGEYTLFTAEGDCCSWSWIENMRNVKESIWRTIVSCENFGWDSWKYSESWDEDECCMTKRYKAVFRMLHSFPLEVEFRNESNGYYGGSLVQRGLSEDGFQQLVAAGLLAPLTEDF